MDDLLEEFLQEATEHIDATSSELLRFEKDQGVPALVASLFRHIHTSKGSSGYLGLPRAVRLTHATETLIGRSRDGRESRAGACVADPRRRRPALGAARRHRPQRSGAFRIGETVRVSVGVLDRLMGIVSDFSPFSTSAPCCAASPG